MLHQGAALAGQPLELLERQGDAADHQLPRPLQVFAKAEATTLFRQFGLDRQAQPAGQPATEAGGQHHPNPHIPQLGRGGSHQHKRFSWCQLHRFWRCFIQPAGQGLKGHQGTAQAFQEQFTGLLHLDFTQLQHAITGIPNGRGALAQVGVGFGLQAKAQGPQLTALWWCVELQQGPRRCHLAGHGLAPAGGGTNQPGAVVV